MLRGTPGRDVILGLGGDDEIVGSLGNDIICGGPGADLIHGGRGNDIVDGGAGDFDRVIGDLGDDHVLGGPGNGDEVAGSLGIDTVSGGPGNMDLVHGDYGYDRMDGGAGGGDIASFATDVGAGQERRRQGLARQAHGARRRPRPALPLREPRGLGLRRHPGRQQAGQRDRRRPRQGRPARRRRRTTSSTATRARTAARAPRAARPPAATKRRSKASAYVEVDATPGGGGGLAIVGRGGPDHFVVAYDADSRGLRGHRPQRDRDRPGLHPARRQPRPRSRCALGGPARWLMADLGPGNDSLMVEGSLAAVGFVRLAGGLGNDTIKGGPEDDLIEAGFGADKLYGGAGSDGLIGSTPGPTFLYGGANGDLLAAGGGCAGGAIVGGPGRDDASFAETQAHPGLLYVSFPLHKAWIDAVKGCNPVRLDRLRRGHGGVLRQRRPDRRRRQERDPRPARRRPHLRQRRRRRPRRPRRRPRRRDPVRARARRSSAGRTCARPGRRAATPSSTPSIPHPVSCGETTIGHPVKGLGKTERPPSRPVVVLARLWR